EIQWHRDGAGRLLSIQEEGTDAPQLRFSWREDGTAEKVVLPHQAYHFAFEGGLLSSIHWTLASGQPRSFDLVQKANSLRINTSKLSEFRFVWNAKTGILMGDGVNRY